MIKIGLSARFMSQSTSDFGVGGKAIQYLEQSMANSLARAGSLVFLIPSIGTTTELSSEYFKPEEYARAVDGLVLQGGVDICPENYGERAAPTDLQSDPLRDRYELALIDSFMRLGKPVLGICRGMQLINVYLGGTLVRDIPTEIQSPVRHYCQHIREQNEHEVDIKPDTYLAKLYGAGVKLVNSVHHQSVKKLGRELVVEADCPTDGVVEAIRYQGKGYLVGVQWHPEYHDKEKSSILDSEPLYKDFLKTAEASRLR